MTARKEAIGRIAAAADWGWKGGKKGEVTGGDYVRRWEEAEEAGEQAVVQAGFPRASIEPVPDGIFWDTVYDNFDEVAKDFYRQLEGNAQKLRTRFLDPALPDGELMQVASGFKNLEDADVPREWTGKLFPVLYDAARSSGHSTIKFHHAKRVSDLMRPMTHEQRLAFVEFMRTNRTGSSIEEIASRVKRLYGTQTSRRPRPS